MVIYFINNEHYSQGLYSPLQCSSSECHCVDVNTGEEYPGTRSEEVGTFDCDYAGNTFNIEEGNGGLCGEQVCEETCLNCVKYVETVLNMFKLC